MRVCFRWLVFTKGSSCYFIQGQTVGFGATDAHAVLETNRKQVETALNLIRKTGKRRLGVLELSFKAGTDDRRESPIVVLIETLIGKGYKLAIYDEEVALAKLYGANKRYLEESIPHITSLMKSSVQEVIEKSDIVIVSKK